MTRRTCKDRMEAMRKSCRRTAKDVRKLRKFLGWMRTDVLSQLPEHCAYHLDRATEELLRFEVEMRKIAKMVPNDKQ